MAEIQMQSVVSLELTQRKYHIQGGRVEGECVSVRHKYDRNTQEDSKSNGMKKTLNLTVIHIFPVMLEANPEPETLCH